MTLTGLSQGLASSEKKLGSDKVRQLFAESIESVNTVERRGKGFRVRTNSGTIQADEVIVATNGYTGRLTPWIQRRLVSTRSLMIATEELPEEMARSLIPQGRMIFDTKLFLFYFRLSPDGKRLLFGGRPKSPWKTMRQNAAFMQRDMLRVYPQLKDIRIEYAWWGKLGFTWDRSPHIGRHDGYYYALGYCGHGVALATYLGEKLAEMILGKGTPTVFAELKFQAIPLYTGKAWFRPMLYGYYSLLDKLP